MRCGAGGTNVLPCMRPPLSSAYDFAQQPQTESPQAAIRTKITIKDSGVSPENLASTLD